MRGKLFLLFFCPMLVGQTGCSLVLPEITHQPVIRNPFPQLSRVAVAPFINHSDDPTVNGRHFAMAYFAELQSTSGFEVVPLGVTEEAIIAHRIDLSGPGEARRLAQILGVDAVVVGAVTDYFSYYPPRCGLRVEWYTANPGYHEIPTGYGLPWNTPEEEFIPDSLVYESEMALARAQMAALAPNCDQGCQTLPPPPSLSKQVDPASFQSTSSGKGSIRILQNVEELPAGRPESLPAGSGTRATDTNVVAESIGLSEPTDSISTLRPGWPDENCLGLPSPQAIQPVCEPHHGPVLQHTRIYRGTDPDVTQALKSYVYYRDDARWGGWESYLQRSDDFIRFCCHMHISEMLAARGGAQKTRVVWRWPESR